jgi:hypothetical protein
MSSSSNNRKAAKLTDIEDIALPSKDAEKPSDVVPLLPRYQLKTFTESSHFAKYITNLISIINYLGVVLPSHFTFEDLRAFVRTIDTRRLSYDRATITEEEDHIHLSWFNKGGRQHNVWFYVQVQDIKVRAGSVIIRDSYLWVVNFDPRFTDGDSDNYDGFAVYYTCNGFKSPLTQEQKKVKQ